MAEALKINTGLTYLGLDVNAIGPEGARRLAEALKVNATLIDLSLNHNYSIGADLKKEIEQLLSREHCRAPVVRPRSASSSIGGEVLSFSGEVLPLVVTRACEFRLMLLLSPQGLVRYHLALLHLQEALQYRRRYGLRRKSALMLLVPP